jgi:hypothetical protein
MAQKKMKLKYPLLVMMAVVIMSDQPSVLIT